MKVCFKIFEFLYLFRHFLHMMVDWTRVFCGELLQSIYAVSIGYGAYISCGLIRLKRTLKNQFAAWPPASLPVLRREVSTPYTDVGVKGAAIYKSRHVCLP